MTSRYCLQNHDPDFCAAGDVVNKQTASTCRVPEFAESRDTVEVVHLRFSERAPAGWVWVADLGEVTARLQAEGFTSDTELEVLTQRLVQLLGMPDDSGEPQYYFGTAAESDLRVPARGTRGYPFTGMGVTWDWFPASENSCDHIEAEYGRIGVPEYKVRGHSLQPTEDARSVAARLTGSANIQDR